MRYRHVVVRALGGPEVLEVAEDELPDPGPGEARIKILAADVGFSDVNIRRGRYPGAPRPPFTPGYAIVGVVGALGPGTTGLELGQPVAALTFLGGYSQAIVLAASELVPVRPGLDPAEAVTLVFNYLAAYQMLHRVARVASGQRVLVHGAGGGLGTAFLELGRLAGLVMYGTASKPKHGLVTSLGATPIDYRSEDFVARVAELTDGAGVDAAFDPMGSAHLRQTARATRHGGALVAYGYYAAAAKGRSAIRDVVSQYLLLARSRLPPQRLRVAFYDTRPTRAKHPDWYREDVGALCTLLAAGRLHPVIAARIPLEGVVEAHRRIERADVEGRIVLLPNG
ncbi:MAG TPA: medium chain dehydrogenase/reductase family protein [Candidatus Limnocylindrales bacterium]